MTNGPSLLAESASIFFLLFSVPSKWESRSFTRGKGTSGMFFPRNAHKGPHPFPIVYSSLLSGGTICQIFL